jgi:hypothetical protein
MSGQTLHATVADRPLVPGLTYSACLLAYLYVSRFLPDAVLVPVALAFLVLGRIAINRLGLTITLCVTVLIGVQVFAFGGRIEHAGQALHLISLLGLLLVLDDRDFRPELIQQFCKATTLLNAVLLLGALVPQLQEIVLWGLDRGTGRYQSILPEPSFVALYSVFNFYVLLLGNARRWAFLNLVPLVATFSFSGALAFAFLGCVFVRVTWRPVLAAAVAVLAIVGLAYLLFPDMVTAVIVERGADLLAGDSEEESLTLRLFAPIDLMRSVVTGGNPLFGLGIGNVEHYIYVSQVDLPNHWRADGERSSQPDSVIAFIIAAFGVVGAAVTMFGGWLLLSLPPRRPVFKVIRWYVVTMAVFSGLFISVHFFVWIYLLRQEQLYCEDSPTRAAPAVSA